LPSTALMLLDLSTQALTSAAIWTLLASAFCRTNRRADVPGADCSALLRIINVVGVDGSFRAALANEEMRLVTALSTRVW
jgi:hypothetical protein